MQMEIMGFAKDNIDDLWVDPYDYQVELKKAIDYLNYRYVNVSLYNSTLCLIPESLWKFSKKSISSWKNMYLSECENCDVKGECGGFFESSGYKKSDYITSIKYNKI